KRTDDALREADQLLARDPQHREFRRLKAAALAQAGQYEDALAIHDRLRAEDENDATAWLNTGIALKKLGRTRECIAALRKTIALQPTASEAWWAIASLKSEPFSDEDVRTLEGARQQPGLSSIALAQIEYALGKAYEDRRAYGTSFRHYAEGARLKRATLK